MKIMTIVENTCNSGEYEHEHGLSLYIEYANQKILFDTGASDLFLRNAQKLNINIGEIDTLILSHGHYDHCGGLQYFLERNNTAKIYANIELFNKHYSYRENNNLVDIGVNRDLQEVSSIIYTDGIYQISENITLFSNIPIVAPLPNANQNLVKIVGDEVLADDFKHENNLIMVEDGRMFLFTGCAHNGIINIIEHCRNIMGRMPDFVIGGFHLKSRTYNSADHPEELAQLSEYLIKTNAKFFTCHCTGIECYKGLKELMGSQIEYLSTGTVLTL